MVYNIGMRRIDIDELAKILKDSDIEDGLTILKDGEDAFTVLKYDDYQELLYYKDLYDMTFGDQPNIKIMGAEDVNLSEEEFEMIKKQLNEAIDATFKPKTSKMN